MKNGNKWKHIGVLALMGWCLGVQTGCKSTQVETFYTYETECLGVDLDGSQRLKAWGSGINKKEATQQALKNAVRDVLFKGIHAGSKECGIRPLLLEVNVAEKNEDYFNAFFSTDGPYLQFVTDETPKLRSREKEYSKNQKKVGVVVRVQRAALKKRMEQDGIIK